MYENMQTLCRKLGLAEQVADIERIRRILGREKLILMGHSFGADLAADRGGVVGILWALRPFLRRGGGDVSSAGYLPLAVYLSMGQQHDYSSAYRTVKVPVLVIHGSEDLQPEAVSRAFAAWFPGSRFVRIDGAGHFVFNEQPKRFAQAVGEFLREVAGGAPPGRVFGQEVVGIAPDAYFFVLLKGTAKQPFQGFSVPSAQLAHPLNRDAPHVTLRQPCYKVHRQSGRRP